MNTGTKIRVITGAYKGEIGTIRGVDHLKMTDSNDVIPSFFIDFPNVKIKSLNTVRFLRSEIEIYVETNSDSISPAVS